MVNMKNQAILYGIIGLLLGVVLTTYVASISVNNNNAGMMRMMGINPSMMNNQMAGEEMSMDSMVEELQGKTGDEFDKTFINLMIEHHQGAIDMAKQAQLYAGHDEIKNLADDIITAQTSEIQEMRQWFTNWGY